MGNLLQQLQNNEAVLLMYLTNELEPDDRTEVEQLLSNDAQLRAELAQLRKDYEAVFEGIRLLDVESTVPVSAGVAMREVSRMMKQWKVDQLVVETPVVARKWPRLPWWAYGTATAAAAVLSIVVWWGLKTDVPTNSQGSNTSLTDDSSQADQENLLAIGTDENGRLANAERQASDLQSRTEASQSAAIPGFGPADQTQ